LRRSEWPALLLCFLATIGRANPIGDGLFTLGASLQTVGISEDGQYLDSGFLINAKARINYADVGDAQVTLPVFGALALQGSYSLSESAYERTQVAQDPFGSVLDYKNQADGQAYGGKIFFWPSELFRPAFQGAEDGNPDGPLDWPLLWAGGTWTSTVLAQSILAHSYGYHLATASPNLYQQTKSGEYGLILPLSKRFSVTGSYGRDYGNSQQQGKLTYSDAGGANEVEHVGLNAFFNWKAADEQFYSPRNYFPRVGYVGQFRVGLDYGRYYFIPSARVTDQVVNLELEVPANPCFALKLAYGLDLVDRGPFDSTKGIETSNANLMQQTVAVSGTVNFAGFFH
jgi:hypothetical protein